MMALPTKQGQRTDGLPRSGEQGWALLGLLLALGVMSIVFASSIVPNVQMAVQRDKELEMMYRGEQVAEGIARYYNGGALRGIQLFQRPPYGYLTELAKLRDGVTIGVNERRFVRASAMIDPVSNSEWEPVRARDPRIGKFLQAWAAQTLIPIPPQYLVLAAPPTDDPNDPNDPSDPNDPNDPNDPDPPDPLAHLFQTSEPGQGNAPIVGVAPKRKGKSANAYFGLDRYEDWVFIFIPKTTQQGGGVPPGTPPRVSP